MMMRSALSPELGEVQEELKRITVGWASHHRLDEARAATLRRRAAELCHQHYYAAIPYYRRVAERMDTSAHAPLEQIVERMLVPDDIFKSYPARLLDEGRWAEMTQWISRISAYELSVDTADVETIDDWIAKLAEAGLRLVFSSGTSGQLSFVPRDERTWRAFTELPFLHVAAHLADRGVLPAWKRTALRLAADHLAPADYASLVQRYGLRGLEGFFFNFSGGNQGVQLVGQELGRLTKAACFLYEKKMSAAAVRAIVRGPRSPREQALVDELLDTTVRQKTANYDRVLRALSRAAERRQRVVIFGTPALMMELLEEVQRRGLSLALPQGSTISYGGGWKSFTGARVPEAELVRRLTTTFGVAPAAISEGYSMTEINGLFPRCAQGRFHVPPFLEAVIYAEDLSLRQGPEVRGTLGVLDPFATSYPGFVLTGDNVSLSRAPCPCGLAGPSILRVERSPGKDVKGCGGIMAAVNA